MKKKLIQASYFMLVFHLSVSSVIAQTHSSTNYSVDQSSFTSGSSIDANSTSYNARVSAGDIAVGQSTSTSYRTFTGFINPDEEYAELVIPVTTIDMGVISPGSPGTGSATFTARTYLNDEYVIVTPRNPPTLEGGTEMIDPMTVAAPFNSSLEQFGINLVANTSPVAQGANPSPLPNSQFAFGEAAAGYDTADNYQYNQGDIIAESVTGGYGETEYTISYILNVTSITPAGQYTMEQDLVLLAIF
jgi:hypothetical protein